MDNSWKEKRYLIAGTCIIIVVLIAAMLIYSGNYYPVSKEIRSYDISEMMSGKPDVFTDPKQISIYVSSDGRWLLHTTAMYDTPEKTYHTYQGIGKGAVGFEGTPRYVSARLEKGEDNAHSISVSLVQGGIYKGKTLDKKEGSSAHALLDVEAFPSY